MTTPINQADGYYQNTREELLQLILPSEKNILDVGCAAGKFGEILKEALPTRTVYGVEMDEKAASEARTRLDGVIVGDFRAMQLPYAEGSFDCVVFADVLEHFVDPAAALAQARKLLRDSGVVVCSIPNIRHYSAILRLLRKGWEYEDSGLFDRTHMRFFSLLSIQQMFAVGGWQIETILPKVGASKKMRFLNTILLGKLDEFVAFQYLIRAHKST